MDQFDPDYKFANRKQFALYLACKTCTFAQTVPEMAFYLQNTVDKFGRKCKLSFDVRFKEVMELRRECNGFQDEEPVERDTVYPGTTNAPHDKSDPNLLPDSSDIDFNPNMPRTCLNQISSFSIPKPRTNNWDRCLSQLFDRKLEEKGFHKFPELKEVLEILCTSQIPEFTYKIGLPPQRGLGLDRGLWFYKSERFNSTLEKNKQLKGDMKKIIMVYLYHVWFKRLPAEKLEGVFLALDISNPYCLGKDLAWWMTNVFKDPTAKIYYPDEPDIEIEFISLTLLDRAKEAAEVSESGCSSFEELDAEAREYDQMLRSFGYDVDDEEIHDTDGKEIY